MASKVFHSTRRVRNRLDRQDPVGRLLELGGRKKCRRPFTVELVRVWLERFWRLIVRKVSFAVGSVPRGELDQCRIFVNFGAEPHAEDAAAVGRKRAKSPVGPLRELGGRKKCRLRSYVLGALAERLRPQRCEARQELHVRRPGHDQGSVAGLDDVARLLVVLVDRLYSIPLRQELCNRVVLGDGGLFELLRLLGCCQCHAELKRQLLGNVGDRPGHRLLLLI